MPESDLYDPIKKFLEVQGFVVKGEIGACDVVAVRGDDEVVVVELKDQLNLALVLQAVDRLAVTDAGEPVADPVPAGRNGRRCMLADELLRGYSMLRGDLLNEYSE